MTVDSAVITTHINPDGDAIGSAVAVAQTFKALGKDTTILLPSPCPDYLDWLSPEQPCSVYDRSVHESLVCEADCVIVLDLNAVERFQPLAADVQAFGKEMICIDHHEHPEDFATTLLSDTSSAATCRILYDVLRPMVDGTFPGVVAQALYTGIMTDTGGFRFPRTDGDLHRAVGHLIDCGADPVLTYEMLYNRGSASRLQLMGEALAGMELYHSGRLCVMTVSKAMAHRHNASDGDMEGFVHHTLSIEGVQAGVLLIERDGFVKCSFRSKGSTIVRDVAAQYGGGGHQYAAGARVYGQPLDDVKSAVIESMSSLFR
jgi:bifunctional oligoribonuclease and PAP phosphatase NrnA